jgi:NAD(P)-dependent dehydrogenase (short-subunit alcohol dehydrogenase family)
MSRPAVALYAAGRDEIGRATVLRLARSGMSVVACSQDESWLSRVAAALGEAGCSGLTVSTGPVSGEADHAVNKAIDAFGRIDALIVDMLGWDCPRAVFADSPALRWLKAVSPNMSAAGGGHVVNVVSSLGRYRSSYFPFDDGQEGALDQSAAEGAVLALTRQAAFELAPHKIRVNAVSVGWIRGARSEQSWRRLSDRDREYILEEISLRRLGEPDEVAAAVHFLATPASSYVTGTVLDVNGGWWMS